MEITYKNTRNFLKKTTKTTIFISWLVFGEYPDKLVIAMRNFNCIYSAWDWDKLVGLISAMDDGIMNAYINYLLVKPNIS